MDNLCSVQVLHGRILELTFAGYTSRAMAERAFERASAQIEAHPEVDKLLFNLVDHVGHDPGNTAHGIRWVARYKSRLRRAVLLTRSPTIAALINVSKVMLPWLDARATSDRDEAVAILQESDDVGPQRKSGHYPKARRTRVA